MHRSVRSTAACALALASSVALAAGSSTVDAKFSRAPLPSSVKAAWQHSPYAADDCSICHERNDKKNPGKVAKNGSALCLECHGEFEALRSEKYVHAPVFADCMKCHNPHDAQQRKLLYTESVTSLCTACHQGIKSIAEKSPVKHDPVVKGRACLQCHSPHATKIEKLLTAAPFDQCIGCHSQPGLKDDKGVVMTNFKQLLADNKVLHDPVAAKDCSACHTVHGGENFRMLTTAYPAKFYAPFNPENYALCFGCHNDQVISQRETTTLTRFRDGSRNLHYVHVNKADRGRTCRACHEVHASPYPHQIREAVPYGPKNWMLKVGYEATPTGGMCAKTCHDAKPYVNRTAPVSQK